MASGQLTLSRKAGQCFVVGGSVVQIVKTSRGGTTVRIIADKEVKVSRGEIYRKLVADGQIEPIQLEEFVT